MKRLRTSKSFLIFKSEFKKMKCSPPLTVLQAVELPAGVAHLAASLAHVDRDALPLQNKMADFYQNNLN
jgi:hypothetical protein